MLQFSARYARKVQYCNISCKVRRKNCIFLTFAPPIRNMDRRLWNCSVDMRRAGKIYLKFTFGPLIFAIKTTSSIQSMEFTVSDRVWFKRPTFWWNIGSGLYLPHRAPDTQRCRRLPKTGWRSQFGIPGPSSAPGCPRTDTCSRSGWGHCCAWSPRGHRCCRSLQYSISCSCACFFPCTYCTYPQAHSHDSWSWLEGLGRLAIGPQI